MWSYMCNVVCGAFAKRKQANYKNKYEVVKKWQVNKSECVYITGCIGMTGKNQQTYQNNVRS